MSGADLAVPAGYVVHRVGRTLLVLDRGHSGALVDLRLADSGSRRQLFSRAPRRGRGTNPVVAIGTGATMVLRRYRHGGLLAGLTGTLLLGPDRALAELRVTAAAEAAGAPVPHVLAAVMWPRWGPFWSAVIGTREEQGAIELMRAWGERKGRPRRALLRSIGLAIRRLHDAGVDHPDLQVRNLLLVGDPERVVVIDLDRGGFQGAPLSPRRRAANLGRLYRSAVKEGLVEPRPPCRDLAALVAGYVGRDRELRRRLRTWAPVERIRLRVHRLGYAARPRSGAHGRQRGPGPTPSADAG